MSLSNDQVNELLKPINPSRVSKDGKGFAHVEAWDVRKTMNQMFGFAEWSSNVTDMNLVYETQTNGQKPRWNVCYRARCVIQINDTVYAEWAVGDATNYPSRPDAHDQAIKTAESQAFKRCAVNLGDQFGLSLYKNGSVEASVGDVIGREHADDGRVSEFIALLKNAKTKNSVDDIAESIRTLDLGSSSKNELLNAYRKTMAGLEEK